MPLPTSGQLGFGEIMNFKGMSGPVSLASLVAAYPDVDQSQPFSISDFYGKGVTAHDVTVIAYSDDGLNITVEATEAVNTDILVTVAYWGDMGDNDTTDITISSGQTTGTGQPHFTQFGEVLNSTIVQSIVPNASGNQNYVH